MLQNFRTLKGKVRPETKLKLYKVMEIPYFSVTVQLELRKMKTPTTFKKRKCNSKKKENVKGYVSNSIKLKK
jgi:hypothetical protein